ncbi:MAG: Rz1-like lysis system protein LysC [Ewingella sp.]
MRAPALCLLPLLLISCVRTQTVYVPAAQIPTPAALLADTTIPAIPERFTWGSSLLLNEKLLTSIGSCNLDKAALREIETDRKADK